MLIEFVEGSHAAVLRIAVALMSLGRELKPADRTLRSSAGLKHVRNASFNSRM